LGCYFVHGPALKILIVDPATDWSIKDVYDGWCAGLRAAGVELVEYEFGTRLAFYRHAKIGDEGLPAEMQVGAAWEGLPTAILQHDPDLVLFVTGRYVEPELLDMIRPLARVGFIFTESPYEDDVQVAMASHVDLCLVNDPTNLGRFAEVCEAHYFHHSYNPSVHYPGNQVPATDLVIVGTGYQSRTDFLESADWSGIDISLFGNWWRFQEPHPYRAWVKQDDVTEGIDNHKPAGWYRSARAGLNIYRREAARPELSTGWAMGPREVEMAACGLFFLTEPRGEVSEVFPHLPKIESPGDCVEQLRWWLTHDSERETAALRARDAISEWTFEHSARRFCNILDK